MKRKVLVVDVGGTHVKLLMSPLKERQFPSGARMGPKQFLARFKETVRGWKFDRASIGFPAPLRNGRIQEIQSIWVKAGSASIFQRHLEYRCV